MADAIGKLGEIWEADKAPPRLYIFAASHDWLVPKGAITLPNAETYVIQGVSHLSLIQSDQLHRKLIEILH
ncbi:MAG: hypothetical protein AB7F31_02455 [Parachlamydiales bacterium]